MSKQPRTRVHFITYVEWTANKIPFLDRAGFFPGAVYLISRWYLPHESQVRIALFYTASALAGAFSGLLAFGIAKLNGLGKLEGWRWIFILEGIASVIAGIMTFFFLIDTPALSPWLTPDEKKYLELRQLAVQGNSMRAREAEKSRKWEILRSALTDWQVYLQALVILVEHCAKLRNEVHDAPDHQEYGVF